MSWATMGAKDRRAIVLGVSILVAAVIVFRVLPGYRGALADTRDRLATEQDALARERAAVAAARRNPQLHLALAGGGPEEAMLRERLGDRATFLGWLHGQELARAYASADIFLFASRTDTFGQVILEAQASDLPVVAVGEGGPASLIEHGETGLLTEADTGALADAVLELARSPLLHERLRRSALTAVRGRT